MIRCELVISYRTIDYTLIEECVHVAFVRRNKGNENVRVVQ